MLINAQEMAEKHPETFYAPSKEDLEALEAGLSVKVCLADEECGGMERFWVTISSIEDGEITGIVDNDLIYTEFHGFACGDEITLKPENIYEVLRKSPELRLVH